MINFKIFTVNFPPKLNNLIFSLFFCGMSPIDVFLPILIQNKNKKNY